MSGLPGGWTKPTKADEEIQKICDRIKNLVEARTDRVYYEFIAYSYSCQVTEGVNYIIKVHVGGEKYIHLSFFQALLCYGGELLLGGVEQDKTKDDPLIPL